MSSFVSSSYGLYDRDSYERRLDALQLSRKLIFVRLWLDDKGYYGWDITGNCVGGGSLKDLRVSPLF
ncbi:hypothetical protein [Thalassospira alkalitolerans]|uniref:hypothetical protein n=1 Tax=Thalassospira alkalitolerans TaxID=1293890 RepID=UPI003AA7E9A0